jgi:hypothetical protein
MVTITIVVTINSFSQTNKTFWSEANENEIKITGKREIVPEKYKTFSLDYDAIKASLKNSPNDKVINIANSINEITLPMPNGNIERFKVVESNIMDDALQAGFPDIRTYSIKGIDDVYAYGKIDVGAYGFHGMIRSVNGDVFVDPYCQNNTRNYISYYTSDFIKPINERGFCEGAIDETGYNQSKTASPSALICAGANLRTYRLAVGCTGQYAIAATGVAAPTTAQILNKVVISINRVDGVYETEVAVRLILVSSTTLTLYGKTATGAISPAPTATVQPYTGNANGGTLIGESQTVINNLIGSANYDIGHTFSTGGGGLANLGCVCGSSKASGITGSPSPVGDAYDIDYVAHEMGHQFGGNHTFNGNIGSCGGGNRNASTAVEPGSGVTIMAYAGICGTNDLAPHSIAYFSAISYDEIMNFSNVGGGNSCKVLVASGNSAPVVNAGSAYSVPANTPFSLTGSATDPNVGDVLTYQWEEIDLGTTAGSWNTGSQPFFRSYNPVSSPTRIFPIMASILTGSMQTTIGEYLPTTAQILKFRLNVRDNKTGGGGVCSATTQVTVNAGSPFIVTSQSVTGISYVSGSAQTVNWNVSGTNAAPINCANVNIYVSNDAGVTFTLVLANTPNDGTEIVNMPYLSVTSTICRVKVESVGNIFFDLNSKAFTIVAGSVGINQIVTANSIGLQLYPNPFTSSVKIEINSNTVLDVTKTHLQIYDVLGNLVKSENIMLTENFSKTFDLSSLANGTYIVIVTDGKQKAVSRLVKL